MKFVRHNSDTNEITTVEVLQLESEFIKRKFVSAFNTKPSWCNGVEP
jgi:hypothetical protein